MPQAHFYETTNIAIVIIRLYNLRIKLRHGQALANGLNLGRVFNIQSGHLLSAHMWCYQVKLTNLKLKTQPIQL
jgi:hypothetical protein